MKGIELARHVERVSSISCEGCGAAGDVRPVRCSDGPWIYCGRCGRQWCASPLDGVAVAMVDLANRADKLEREKVARKAVRPLVGSIYRTK